MTPELRAAVEQISHDRAIMEAIQHDMASLASDLSQIVMKGVLSSVEDSSKVDLSKMMPPMSGSVVDHLQFSLRCVAFMSQKPVALKTCRPFSGKGLENPERAFEQVLDYTPLFQIAQADALLPELSSTSSDLPVRGTAEAPIKDRADRANSRSTRREPSKRHHSRRDPPSLLYYLAGGR